jgi:hypothetical protein
MWNTPGKWRSLARRAAVALGAALGAVLLLGAAACGAGSQTDVDGGPAASPTATGTADAPATGEPSPAADVELLEFEISGGVADPPLSRVTVERGSTVRIVVASDAPDEIHLHGYDHQADVGPGEEGVIEFMADESGLFELETHHSGLVLLQLAVR